MLSYNFDFDSEGIYFFEFSLIFIGISMRVYDGILFFEVFDFGRDFYLEEYSFERRR